MQYDFIGVFASFGLSGIVPAIHYGLIEGWFSKITRNSLGWLILMGEQNKYNMSHTIITYANISFLSLSILVGILYILGALIYALRVPERFYPGKFDLTVSIYHFIR